MFLEKYEIDKQQSVCSLDQSKNAEKQPHIKDQNANTTEIKSLEGHGSGNKQVSIKHFFIKKEKDSDRFHLLPQKAANEATHGATLSMQDQICKAQTLWTMKTAKEDFPFLASYGVPQLFQRMFQSEISESISFLPCIC